MEAPDALHLVAGKQQTQTQLLNNPLKTQKSMQPQ